MIAWAIRQLVLWGIIGFVAYGVVVKVLLSNTPPAPPPLPPMRRQIEGGSIVNSLTFRADRSGHVYIDGEANGSPVRFLLDTGATLVALTMEDAEAAEISRSDLVFDHQVSTANGVTRVAPVTLRYLRIGQFRAYQVPAAVVENLSISLLGQSFLKRLDSYEMRDGVLTLNWN